MPSKYDLPESEPDALIDVLRDADFLFQDAQRALGTAIYAYIKCEVRCDAETLVDGMYMSELQVRVGLDVLLRDREIEASPGVVWLGEDPEEMHYSIPSGLNA